MLKGGKLSHLIKELKQNNGNEHPKAAKKGETFGKKKPLAILIVQPWERAVRQKITQSFSLNPEILFPYFGEDGGIEGPMIIEAEIGGHCIHSMVNTTAGKDQRRKTLYFGSDELRGCKVTFCIQRNHWKTKSQKVTGSAINGSRNGEAPSRRRGNYLKKEHDRSAGMSVGFQTKKDSPNSQTNSGRKSQGGNKPRISRANNNDRFHSHRRGPQQVIWRTCVDFKDLNKACPKDGYPLSEIDWKVESLCGFPFKCFLDAYKGYHQIQMAKEDKEKIAFITSQGILCYTKMPFGLRNAGATYQRKEAFKQMKQLTAELPMLTGKFGPNGKRGTNCLLGSGKRDDGSRVGLILTNPEGVEFTYALTFRFDATNNEAEYKALIAGLRIAKQMGIKNLQANMDSRLVANQVNGKYVAKEVDMIRYLEKSFLEPWLRCIGPLQANHVLREIHEGSGSMHVEAVTPVEIGMPRLRTAEVDLVQNNEALEINLDLLEEKREEATIREAKSKAKMEKYYNSKVQNTSFKIGDLVYRNNDAS
nr:reverse transcriptase domain-containing protein [Tanacetum cinerariifolium]